MSICRLICILTLLNVGLMVHADDDDASSRGSVDSVAVDAQHGANIRGGPSINNRIMGTLFNGAGVIVTGKMRGNWVPVRAGNVTGYIYKTLLKDTETGKTLSRDTEAGVICTSGDCSSRHKTVFKRQREDIEKLSAKLKPAEPKPAPKKAAVNPGRATCYGRELLKTAVRMKSAMANLRGYYHPNRSAGVCATAVRMMLQAAGYTGKGYDQQFGDAVNYHRRPRQRFGNLDEMGMVNEIGKYNAYNAPPGSVLVFAGPLNDEYQRTGRYPPKGRRGGRGAGTWVGHITIKAEAGQGYYTDGNTPEPAIPNRRLVGV